MCLYITRTHYVASHDCALLTLTTHSTCTFAFFISHLKALLHTRCMKIIVYLRPCVTPQQLSKHCVDRLSLQAISMQGQLLSQIMLTIHMFSLLCRGLPCSSTTTLTDRASEDGHTNKFGRALVEFCIQADIAILNGRTSSDPTGKVTCKAPKGSTVTTS